MVEEDLAHGRLVRVLDGYRAPDLPVSAVYPHRLYLAAKVQRFVDFLADRVARFGLGEGPSVPGPDPGPVQGPR
jgi:DNA-binding transcriptional LysR family regulator